MQQLALGLGILATVGSIIAIIMIRQLTSRFDQALGTSTGNGLETTLTSHMERVGQVDLKLDNLVQEYDRLATSVSLASQKISLVRFNPFGDTGGDQSFCLAVLDAHDSGYVLTSIHGREGTRVYVKPVDYAKSKYTLSDEEQRALAQAAQRVVKQSSKES